jgi:hypothetical protein
MSPTSPKTPPTVNQGETPMDRPADPADGAAPARFGRYRILKQLGACGMGTVYLAHDGELDRKVALKVPHLADDPKVRERFAREARAAAALAHPNICPIHDVGELNGRPYLTMRFVDGKPLSALIKDDQPLPPRTAAALVRKVAEAMQYAHAKGVVHRDLKPANIMMEAGREPGRWEPVVIDFGIAVRIDTADARLTPNGAVLGTPAYMAPEQAAGRAPVTGAAADVYSLGAVFYQLLTGRPPFTGTFFEVLNDIVHREPPRPTDLRPGLAPRLEAICLKAMAKKPEDRFASMGDLARALAQYQAAPVEPVGPAPGPDDERQRRRWKVLTWTTVIAVGLLAGTIGVAALRSPGPAATGGGVDKPLPPLALYWQGFVHTNRQGQDLEVRLKDGMTLYSREQYKLVLSPTADCFLYVIGVDKTGPTLLFPHAEIALGNRCRANTEYQLPDGTNMYTLDHQTGTETVYLVASHERLTELEALLAPAARGEPDTVAKIEGLVRALEERSADGIRTRGQTIEPDHRLAKTRLPNGAQVAEAMAFNPGVGYVVHRVRFEHKAPE